MSLRAKCIRNILPRACASLCFSSVQEAHQNIIFWFHLSLVENRVVWSIQSSIHCRVAWYADTEEVPWYLEFWKLSNSSILSMLLLCEQLFDLANRRSSVQHCRCTRDMCDVLQTLNELVTCGAARTKLVENNGRESGQLFRFCSETRLGRHGSSFSNTWTS